MNKYIYPMELKQLIQDHHCKLWDDAFMLEAMVKKYSKKINIKDNVLFERLVIHLKNLQEERNYFMCLSNGLHIPNMEKDKVSHFSKQGLNILNKINLAWIFGKIQIKKIGIL